MYRSFEIDADTVNELIAAAKGKADGPQQVPTLEMLGDLKLAEILLGTRDPMWCLKHLLAGTMKSIGTFSCESLRSDSIIRECHRAICATSLPEYSSELVTKGYKLAEEITAVVRSYIHVRPKVLLAVVASILFVIHKTGIRTFCELARAKWGRCDGT